MKEYWINVYSYPKLKNYMYSHNIPSKERAIFYSDKTYSEKMKMERKTVYRIHVRLK